MRHRRSLWWLSDVGSGFWFIVTLLLVIVGAGFLVLGLKALLGL